MVVLLTQVYKQRMTKHLPQKARPAVPIVARPDAFGVEALGQLPDDGLNPPPRLHQKQRPALLLPFGRAVGRE